MEGGVILTPPLYISTLALTRGNFLFPSPEHPISNVL